MTLSGSLFEDVGSDCALLSCLAEGVDTILAEAWPIDRPLYGLLPVPEVIWIMMMEQVMTQGRTQKLIKRAEAVETQGIYSKADFLALADALVVRSDRVFAVWDGTAGAPGGTGSVVQAAKSQGKEVLHLKFSESSFAWASP